MAVDDENIHTSQFNRLGPVDQGEYDLDFLIDGCAGRAQLTEAIRFYRLLEDIYIDII